MEALRCRLCLTAPGSEHQLQDIFRDQEDHFGCKVRECTGVYVSRQDSLTAICANCVETVHFIDEFRAMCRKSDRSFELAGGFGFEPARWDSYMFHVEELRKLLEPQEGSGSGYLPATVFVKSQQQEQDEVDYAWENVEEEEPVAVKQEVIVTDGEEDYCEGQGEKNDDKEEYSPPRKKRRWSWELEPLTVAKIIHKVPVLWDPKHKGNGQLHQRNLAWEKLAADTKIAKPRLKKMWNMMNDMFHRRRWGSDPSEVELNKLLDSMFGANVSRRNKFHLSKEIRDAMAKIPTADSENDRMKLAQIFYQNQAIWDRTHPDFDKQIKWAKLALQLDTSVVELKHHWKCLKDICYGRRRRLHCGEIKPDHPCLHDPFFLLLEKMWIKNARLNPRLPTRLPVSEKPQKDIEPLVPKNRLQLTQMIYDRDVIWNRDHPEYPDLAKRDAAFEEVASELGLTMPDFRRSWRTLRSFYGNRYRRMKRGLLAPDHPLLQEPVYLMLSEIFGDYTISEGGP